MAYIYAMKPGNRVRHYRKRAGLNQEQLANLAGISQPAISQVENGERPLTVDWMRTFARIFGCAPADLLEDEDNPGRLSAEEAALIEDFRKAEPPQREMVRRVAEPLPGYRAEPARKSA